MQVDITPMFEQAVSEHPMAAVLDVLSYVAHGQASLGRLQTKEYGARWRAILAVLEKAAHDVSEIEQTMP